MTKRVIVTVGPSLLDKSILNQIHNERNIYRINGAHGSIDSIEHYIFKIKSQIKNAKILMDLPGNKIRTCNFKSDYINLKNNYKFSINFDQTNYKDFFKFINSGDEVWANDSMFKFIVDSIDLKNKKIKFLSLSDGKLFNNKGLHVRGIHDHIPFLFEKDLALIDLANKHKIEFIGLSFVRHAKDILEAKKLISYSNIICKVETLSAVKKIDEIFKEVEIILIDRGDLSTEIGLNKIPGFQKHIIDKAIFNNKKIFLATQFLKSMENNPVPTIAEVIDLYNSLKSGIYGIQMSEETAIGKYPKNCLILIEEMIEEINSEIIKN